MRKPDLVVVLPMRLTTISRLRNGRPRQFPVMWQNIRCSILFHLLVPGGKWHTLILMPIASANSWMATFHRRRRLPLLPPPSAVTSSSLAPGYTFEPMLAHHRRNDSVAK